MSMTIKEFVDMHIDVVCIGVYSNEEDRIMGVWWSDELPIILYDYSVDSLDPPVYAYGAIVQFVNSDDCTIESLRSDADFIEFDESDVVTDLDGAWESVCNEIYGGDEE